MNYKPQCRTLAGRNKLTLLRVIVLATTLPPTSKMEWPYAYRFVAMKMMMKLPILPCAEKLELVLSTGPNGTFRLWAFNISDDLELWPFDLQMVLQVPITIDNLCAESNLNFRCHLAFDLIISTANTSGQQYVDLVTLSECVGFNVPLDT